MLSEWERMGTGGHGGSITSHAWMLRFSQAGAGWINLYTWFRWDHGRSRMRAPRTALELCHAPTRAARAGLRRMCHKRGILRCRAIRARTERDFHDEKRKAHLKHRGGRSTHPFFHLAVKRPITRHAGNVSGPLPLFTKPKRNSYKSGRLCRN